MLRGFKSKVENVRSVQAAVETSKTAPDVEAAILDGRLRLLVPVDARVSPWPVPRLIELSPSQAKVMIEAIREMPPTERHNIEYVLRSDGTVAIRRTNAEAYPDGVSAVRADHVQGDRAYAA